MCNELKKKKWNVQLGYSSRHYFLSLFNEFPVSSLSDGSWLQSFSADVGSTSVSTHLLCSFEFSCCLCVYLGLCCQMF